MPRLAGWHRAELLHRALYERQMYFMEFFGFYAGNHITELDERPQALQDAVIRYWLARSAPNDVFLWNVGFEVGEYQSVPSWPAPTPLWRAEFAGGKPGPPTSS